MNEHPEFEKCEYMWADTNGNHYRITLSGNRIFEVEEINSNTGGGFYAALTHIGEYGLEDSCNYRKFKEDKWKECFAYGIFY
ncbi:MAG: hypothetical protein MJ159_03765 [Treponemataceae bacterium]|nr:hypothetical protein [Treponemataceae bacterium]